VILEVAADTEFQRLMTFAACAGGCRALGRLQPEAALSLNRAARRYSTMAAIELNAWMAGLELGGSTPPHVEGWVDGL
jgi:hypothetical protein